jgi:sugar phosphate isomerase/epimerase
MNNHVTRRRFLVDTGCLSVGVLAATGLNHAALAAERPAWLATCRDAILRTTGQGDCWSALRAVGAEGVEVEVTPELALPSLFHPTAKYTVANAAGIEQLAADAKTAGQSLTAFCMHNQFEQRPDFEVENCRRLAEAAKTLGIPTIRIDFIPAKLSRAEFLKQSTATLKKIMAATEPTGVTFAVENHSNTTNDPVFLAALLDGVGSKRLGVTLDVGNFYWFGHPLSKVYELCEQFAPRVFHTHCKNIRYPEAEREKRRPMGWEYGRYARAIYDGDIDYGRVAAILTKVGYRNDLCIENEFLGQLPPAKATEMLAKEIQLLKQRRSA